MRIRLTDRLSNIPVWGESTGGRFTCRVVLFALRKGGEMGGDWKIRGVGVWGSSNLVRGFMRKFHEFDHFGGSVLDIWHFGFPLTDVQSQPMAKGKRKTENSKLKTPEVSAHT